MASYSPSETASKDEPRLIVAGKPGNGKSTALNNIFGLNLQAKAATHSVTKKFELRKVEKHGICLTVFDTPGLGALDIDKEAVTAAMNDSIIGTDFTLLYCLSVAPCSRLTEVDRAIIHSLHASLGKEVWDKCVVLFTFSDTARRDEFGSTDETENYKAYMKSMAEGFSALLKECGSDVPSVKTVFEFDINELNNREEGGREIVAFPVGKYVGRMGDPDILPDIIGPEEDWTDLVFLEIMRKTKEERRKNFVALKYGAAVAASAAAFGAVGGIGALAYTGSGIAVIGSSGSLGAIGAGIGAIVGGPVGAGIGYQVGVVTTVAGLSIGAIMTAIKLKKLKRAKQELMPK